jgi:hypothetical protein
MPITPPSPIPGQLVPSGQQPYVNQQNFGQIWGECASWAPHAPIPMLQNWTNNAVRKIYDRRNWYGLLQKGQLISPGMFQQGSVSLTFGSTSVQGTNTNWTQSLNGVPITQQQFRCGYYAPIYNIVALNQTAQVLTLELPWGNPTVTSTGYFISQYYWSIPNIRMFYSMKNLQLYYRISVNYPQAIIENLDPSRLIVMYPRLAATMPPDVNGNYQLELWPAPNSPQTFPWLAFVQPPNLVNDTDNIPAFLRTDTIKAWVISEALMYKPKDNPNYSEATALSIAESKRKEFEYELVKAENADEGLWRQDLIMAEEMSLPLVGPDGIFSAGGDTLAAMTPATAWGYY